MAVVQELCTEESTFIYFTSDNGPYLEKISDTGDYHGGRHGIYKGGKMSQTHKMVGYYKDFFCTS